jgi:hypothetical protein
MTDWEKKYELFVNNKADKLTIKEWYLLANNRSRNPVQLIGLNDSGKELIQIILLGLVDKSNYDYDTTLKITNELKNIYNNYSEDEKKDEFVFFKLLQKVYELTKEWQFDFDFDKGLEKLMPEFTNHLDFKTLNYVKFGDYFKINAEVGNSLVEVPKFFINTLLKGDIDVNFRRQLEDSKQKADENPGDSAAKFEYECYCEYALTSIVIIMSMSLKFIPLEDKNVKILEERINGFGALLENYLYTMLNKEGVSTPSSLHSNVNKYINAEADKQATPLAKLQFKLDAYQTFFTKLNLIRKNPDMFIKDNSMFFDSLDAYPTSSDGYLYNSGYGYLWKSQGAEKRIKLRSFYYRGDYPFENMIINGFPLSYNFWKELDDLCVASKEIRPGYFIGIWSNPNNLAAFYESVVQGVVTAKAVIKENGVEFNGKEVMTKQWTDELSKIKKIVDENKIECLSLNQRLRPASGSAALAAAPAASPATPAPGPAPPASGAAPPASGATSLSSLAATIGLAPDAAVPAQGAPSAAKANPGPALGAATLGSLAASTGLVPLLTSAPAAVPAATTAIPDVVPPPPAGLLAIENGSVNANVPGAAAAPPSKKRLIALENGLVNSVAAKASPYPGAPTRKARSPSVPPSRRHGGKRITRKSSRISNNI